MGIRSLLRKLLRLDPPPKRLPVTPRPAPKSEPAPSPALRTDPDYVGMDRHALANSFSELLLESQRGNDEFVLNESERYILDRVDELLNGEIPDAIIPKLPEVATSLFRELSDPDVSQDRILSYLNRDPALVSEVLRMANSPIFRVSADPLENLDRAVVLLGLQNLKSLVSSVLMKPILEIRPIYFRMFGQHLWQHSLDCAQACQTIDRVQHRGDPFNSYLVGLMHDVGKLAIFRLLIDSFREVAPHIQPRGEFFSQVVRDKSALLTLRIVEQWSFPPYLRQALAEQQEGWPTENRSVYGFFLQQANMLAEFKHIVECQAQHADGFDELAVRYRIPVELYRQVFPDKSST